MFCSGCGAKAAEGNRFCASCGALLSKGLGGTVAVDVNRAGRVSWNQPGSQYNDGQKPLTKVPLGLILGMTGATLAIITLLMVGIDSTRRQTRKLQNEAAITVPAPQEVPSQQATNIDSRCSSIDWKLETAGRKLVANHQLSPEAWSHVSIYMVAILAQEARNPGSTGISQDNVEEAMKSLGAARSEFIAEGYSDTYLQELSKAVSSRTIDANEYIYEMKRFLDETTNELTQLCKPK